MSARWLALWPGLPQLWLLGSWWGLSAALGFTLILNVLVTASFLWTEWWGSSTLLIGWICLGTIWLGSLVLAVGKCVEWSGPLQRRASEDLFHLAQGQYLKGDWYEAESLLGRMIQQDPADMEAHLLLASVYRRTHRMVMSRRTLKYVERLEHSDQWLLEIRLEREQLNRMELEGTERREELYSDAA